MDLTPAELTILGLIVEQPRHGYELEQVIAQRGVRQWTDIGFSSIYYVLTRLERRGLIDADEGRGKSRRVFRPTEEGNRVAADATREFIAELQSVRHPILIGLANMSLIGDASFDEALRHRLGQVEKRIASIRSAELKQSPLPHPAREVFSFSLCLWEAERAWLAARVEVSR